MPVLPRYRSLGYNLVEVLVTLTIASIITITLVNFVNDADMRHKIAVARADINRISMAAHLAEADLSKMTTMPSNSIALLNLPRSSRLAWALSGRLLELPREDPWGNRYIQNEPKNISDTSTVRFRRLTDTVEVTSTANPTPYVIDEGLGRVISAGPDGIIDTRIGQDPADSESDLIVDYRHKPWLFYNVGTKMYVNSADGAASTTSTEGIFMGEGTNSQISPDGLKYAAVKADGRLVIGTLAWALSADGNASTPRADEVVVAPRPRSMAFSRNSWVTTATVPSVSGSVFPVWLPDSSGVVFVVSGNMYRYDPSRGKSDGSDRGEVLLLAGGTGLSDAPTDQRIIRTSRRTALYANSVKGFYLSISPDSKIAYRNATGGITLVLGDGTAIRTLKGSGDNAPIAWLDNGNLIYWDRAKRRLNRIAQDGSIDIPLHSEVVSAGGAVIDAVHNPSLSPEGKYLAFLKDSGHGYVMKTDGTGFVTNPQDEILFEGSANFKVTPSVVWRQALDCSQQRLLYLPSTDPDKPILNFKFDLIDKFRFNATSLYDPEDCVIDTGSGALSTGVSKQAALLTGLSVLSFDVSRDEKLIAVVSDKDSTARLSKGRGGVFVIPITGDSKGMTQLDLASAPSSAQYAYVAWLLN